MGRLRVAIRLIAGVAVGVVGLGGCAGSGSPTESPVVADEDDPQSVFEHLARGYLDNAESQGFSQDQVALLERAVESSEVSFDDYEAAVQNTLDCWDSAGIDYRASPPSDDRGFPWIDFGYASQDGSFDPVAEACITKHSAAIDTLYQMQPSSIEAVDARFEAAMPQLIACLRDGGYLLETPDPTIERVKEAYLLATQENYVEGSSSGTDIPFPGSCLIAAGIPGF